MSTEPLYLYVERIVPSDNMARFYALSLEVSLFGTISLIRRWGRIGTRGREKIHLCDTETEARDLFCAMARQKRQRGYCPRRG